MRVVWCAAQYCPAGTDTTDCANSPPPPTSADYDVASDACDPIADGTYQTMFRNSETGECESCSETEVLSYRKYYAGQDYIDSDPECTSYECRQDSYWQETSEDYEFPVGCIECGSYPGYGRCHVHTQCYKASETECEECGLGSDNEPDICPTDDYTWAVIVVVMCCLCSSTGIFLMKKKRSNKSTR